MDGHEISIVYCLTEKADECAIRAAVGQLSGAERQRHDRLVHARDRRDFALAHAMLRRVLSSYEPRPPLDWTFEANAYGKPFLVPSSTTTGLSFNLSHCDGLVACIVAVDVDVGIDAEAIDGMLDADTMARQCFSRAEIDAIRRCGDENARQERFVELWTLKEAYVKACGRGLSMPLAEFAFVFDVPGSVALVGEKVAGASWQCALFAPSARHRMAIVLEGRAGEQHRLVARLDPALHSEDSRELLPLRHSFAGTTRQ